MNAMLDKIENTPNGAAHIAFFTDNTFSFTVPKAFALSVCRYIIDSISKSYDAN